MTNATRFARQAANALIASARMASLSAVAVAKRAANEAARLTSYPVPTNVLTASDAGATATIDVAAHSRVYPVQGTVDVLDVAIAAGQVTGLAFSTLYYVYYDDETLADPTPTFLATVDQLTAQVGTAAGRHFVGLVTTPADGAAPTSGSGGGRPPGGGGGDILV